MNPIKHAAFMSRRAQGRDPTRKKLSPRELLQEIFSSKHDPLSPAAIPRGKHPEPKKGVPSEGRGTSGLEELKVTSADEAFYAGVYAAMEKTAILGALSKIVPSPFRAMSKLPGYGTAYGTAQKLLPKEWRDVASFQKLKGKYPGWDPKKVPKTFTGHIFGGMPMYGGVAGAGLSALSGDRPQYQGWRGASPS